jgi:steroid 5-alpha reductase family enzyme
VGTGDKVLCSGFWGLSRHINYLGEIIQVHVVHPSMTASQLLQREPSFIAIPAYLNAHRSGTLFPPEREEK